MRRPLATAALSLLACSGASAQSISDIWNNNCASCHGKSGQGGGAGTRTLLDGDKHLQKHDRPFFDAIKNGVEGSAMTGFANTLSDEKIWGLVVHTRELQSRARRDALGSPKESGGVYQTAQAKYRIEDVITGLDTPWSVDFLPAGGPLTGILVTERDGPVRLFADGKLSKPIAGTPKVYGRGQGGMMDVALHPDFTRNGWVYLCFSDPLEQNGRTAAMTKVVRGKITSSAEGLSWTDEQVLFVAKPEHYVRSDIHFGSRIVFQQPQPPQPDGRYFMYFAIGERGNGNHAQELARPNGKVHRLWDDGKVPSDNPFIATTDAYTSIWSYGHRNPQGLVFDLAGNLWDTEHGPRGGDELNLVQKHANYGWPEVSFGMNYDGSAYRVPWAEKTKDGSPITMPADRWLPSIGACGLDVMKGDAFKSWHGDLMAGGLSGANVDRIRIKDGVVVDREEIFHNHGRVRDVVCGPDGFLYVVLNDPHKVVRLVPAQ